MIHRDRDQDFWKFITLLASAWYLFPGNDKSKFIFLCFTGLLLINVSYKSCIRSVIFQRDEGFWGALRGEYCSSHDKDLTIILLVVDIVIILIALFYFCCGSSSYERRQATSRRSYYVDE
jgi:nitric oxide reductase large subunit